MTARWYPPSERPRLRRALLQELADARGYVDAADVHARVAARDVREVAFVHSYRELVALEQDGLARSRLTPRDPRPMRRRCRRFAVTYAGAAALDSLATPIVLGGRR